MDEKPSEEEDANEKEDHGKEATYMDLTKDMHEEQNKSEDHEDFGKAKEDYGATKNDMSKEVETLLSNEAIEEGGPATIDI